MATRARRAPAPTARRRGRPPKDARPPGAPTTKELIVRAAADAFADRGFEGANLVDIAAAAGVTTGAVYSHFRSKAELLLTVVTSTLEAVHPVRAATPDVTPAYLHEWVRWLIAAEQADLRALIAEIHHAAMRDAEVRDLLGEYGSRYAAMIAEMVSRWQHAGLVADDRDPRAVAQLFLTQALGLCTTGAFQPGVLRNRRVVALFDRHLAALLGEPEPTGR